MNRNLFNVVALIVGTALLASCGGKDKNSIAVPKDAAFVFHINAPSLSSKLSWKEIQASEWFKDLQKNTDDSTAQKLLENPDYSGINLQSDITFFMKNHGRAGYVVFQGALKDATAFEAFYKKTFKDAVAAKDGDMNILKNRDRIMTWNSSRFIFVGGSPNTSSFTGESYDLSALESRSIPVDSLVKFAKDLYNLDNDNSLFSDKRFAELIKEEGDMHLWMSAQNIYGNSLPNVLSMLKLSTLLEGNITAGTVNFDNGKISMKTKSYYNSELAKVYEKYKMKPVDAAVLNRIPSQNVVGLMTFNYPPEGLKEFMKLLGVDGFVNNFMGEIGYSLDEFVKANKGDVLFAVTDLEWKQQTISIPNPEGGAPMVHSFGKPDMQFLFATSINDKPAFEKLVANVQSKIGELPEGRFPPVKYSLNDNWFAVGTSEDQVNKFLAGGNNNQPFASKLAGNPMVIYVDLQKAMKPFLNADTANKSANYLLEESIKLWQDVTMIGGEIKDGHMTGSFDINFVDKNTNSLKQLNQYFNKIAVAKKQAREAAAF
jgi:hypothetical protein